MELARVKKKISCFPCLGNPRNPDRRSPLPQCIFRLRVRLVGHPVQSKDGPTLGNSDTRVVSTSYSVFYRILLRCFFSFYGRGGRPVLILSGSRTRPTDLFSRIQFRSRYEISHGFIIPRNDQIRYVTECRRRVRRGTIYKRFRRVRPRSGAVPTTNTVLITTKPPANERGRVI